jgi:hypothetical protein
VRAMSALVSSSGSSTIGNCMDQRHRLRRIAQRQASGTHRFLFNAALPVELPN